MRLSDRPVLICDAMNMFIRSYAAYPSMATDGHAVGGIVGFMKTLSRLVNEFSPEAVYVVWEGGGSQRRRSLYKEYKLGRRPEKLNRYYEDDIPDTDENRQYQLVTLAKWMKTLPVCQLYVSDCEADDVIAYIVRAKLRDKDKMIVSSDKDMYQLLDDNTVAYNLHHKKVITAEDVFEEFRVKCSNFALAKALCGDASDNIPGVKGIGFKTVSKLYPMLGIDDDILVQQLIDYAAAHVDESRYHQRVIDDSDIVRRNWRLIHLDMTTLSPTQASSIDTMMSSFVPTSDQLALMRAARQEGVNLDTVSLFSTLRLLEHRKEHVNVTSE